MCRSVTYWSGVAGKFQLLIVGGGVKKQIAFHNVNFISFLIFFLRMSLLIFKVNIVT